MHGDSNICAHTYPAKSRNYFTDMIIALHMLDEPNFNCLWSGQIRWISGKLEDITGVTIVPTFYGVGQIVVYLCIYGVNLTVCFVTR